eukprot:157848-Hanusia_phi.AAC.1
MDPQVRSDDQPARLCDITVVTGNGDGDSSIIVGSPARPAVRSGPGPGGVPYSRGVATAAVPSDHTVTDRTVGPDRFR